VISATENSNKFQETRFCKEKSVEDVVTLECLPFNLRRRNCDMPLVLLERTCNGDISIPCKIISYVVSTLQYKEFTLGPTAQATLVKVIKYVSKNGMPTPASISFPKCLMGFYVV
jgi:hypothetical protein